MMKMMMMIMRKKVLMKMIIRDGSRFSNIRLVDIIIEYRLGCAIIF